MSKNYYKCLKLKPYYSRKNFVYLCQMALDKEKITKEEFDLLTSYEQQ